MWLQFILASTVASAIPPGFGAGPFIIGANQVYPHCNGIVTGNAQGELEEFSSRIEAVNLEHPCMAQPPYLVLSFDDNGGVRRKVYLGPAHLFTERGVSFHPGETFSGLGVAAGNDLTALNVQADGQIIALRDSTGHPMWSRGLSH